MIYVSNKDLGDNTLITAHFGMNFREFKVGDVICYSKPIRRIYIKAYDKDLGRDMWENVAGDLVANTKITRKLYKNKIWKEDEKWLIVKKH